MKYFFSTPCLLLILGCCLLSCSSYKQNVMFKVTEGTELKEQLTAAERNYTLQPNDEFSMEVYANNGERLIDPEFALQKETVNRVDTVYD